ncbi:MAG: CsbD family protein, partial [Nocardioidaceae bacterium]|nr:CsbD family protein [Nocardioidaceae bacterium]
MNDELKHKAEGALGKAKEKVGDASDDESLKGEGRRDQSKADLKQAGDKA